MIKKVIYITILLPLSLILSQKVNLEKKTGVITFITSQNIYVRFEDTKNITKNDTLYDKDLQALIVVQHISSNSCSGLSIAKHDVKVGDEVIAFYKKDKYTNSKSISESPILEKNQAAIQSETHAVLKKNQFIKRISGNVSVSSYTNKSNGPRSADFQNWRYNISVNADTIANSDLFFSSYINFSYRADRWSEIKNSISEALKIYDLSLKYEFLPKTSLTLGRKINFKTSSLGAIDGLQFETNFQNLCVGIIAGAHPSFNDYGLDMKMFEYGGYINRIDSLGSYSFQNTVGVFEQTNNFITDRRFLYFQNITNISTDMSLFVSSEFDMYKRKNGSVQNVFDMTSLFANYSYNPANWIGFNFSYDARKSVIYYESFKTFADSILESATRKGLSFRINLRPINYLWISSNYNYRFSEDDPRPSKNFGININYLQVPIINSGINCSYNRIEAGYVTGNYYSGYINKDILKGLINISAGYKYIDYIFTSGNYNFQQKIANLDFSIRPIASMYFSASYEGTFQEKTTYSRLYLNASLRF